MVQIIYLICEDSGSGLQFCSKICSVLVGDENFQIVKGDDGNTGLKGKLVAIGGLLSSNDKVIVFFDNIEDTESFSTVRFLQQLKRVKEMTGVSLYISSYYCFEEVFLSSLRVLNLVKHSKLSEVHKEIFDKLYFMINNGVNYYEHKELFYSALSIKDELNKEQFCNYVLSSITRKLGVEHKVKKGKLGACWLDNCATVEFEGKEFQCEKCYDTLKNLSEREKIEDICTNSILKDNVNLIDFIVNVSKFEVGTKDVNAFTGMLNGSW